MISQEELSNLLPSLGSDRIEKTVSKTDADKFGEAICSFCNDMPNHRLPGYLIIGANDNGSLNGTVVDEQLIQTLLSYRTDGRIVPPPAMVVAKFSYPEGDVAVVEVQPSVVPPTRFKGKVCIRIGPRKGIANEAEERILSEKRSTFARSFDTQPNFGSNIDDISIDVFKLSYLPTAIDEATLIENGRELKQQLSSLKFYDLKADVPTNAGILMFGKNPRFYLSGAYVQYVRFVGEDEVSDFDYEYRFDGDLTTQMKIMDEFIKSQIVKRVQLKLTEDYVAAYPASAVQELLYNAIIHRDYQSNAPIKFYEFSDRIEITNPGGLYGDARPENFPIKMITATPRLPKRRKILALSTVLTLGLKEQSPHCKKMAHPIPFLL